MKNQLYMLFILFSYVSSLLVLHPVIKEGMRIIGYNQTIFYALVLILPFVTTFALIKIVNFILTIIKRNKN